MKFGKLLKNSMRDKWKNNYINYDKLKRILKTYTEENKVISENNTSFHEELLIELNQIVSFGTNIRSDLSNNCRKVSHLIEQLKCWQKSGFPDLENTILKIEEETLKLGKELCFFLNYIELNVTAVTKVLKKHDKKLGQHIGPTFLDKFKKTHLDTFTDISELSRISKIVESILEECRLLKTIDVRKSSSNSKFISSRTLKLGKKIT